MDGEFKNMVTARIWELALSCSTGRIRPYVPILEPGQTPVIRRFLASSCRDQASSAAWNLSF